MSRHAEQIMLALIILLAAAVILLLAGRVHSLDLIRTQAVDIRRAVIAPVLAFLCGIAAFAWRNFK